MTGGELRQPAHTATTIKAHHIRDIGELLSAAEKRQFNKGG
jgi:hypothetical protein